MRTLLALVIIPMAAAPSAAQTLLFEVEGLLTGDDWGLFVRGAGDVNHDGYDDVIASAPGLKFLLSCGIPPITPGSVRVLSGIDGTTLHTLSPLADCEYVGWGIDGVGDVDLDGHDDFVIGPVGQASGPTVHSGVDGSPLIQVAPFPLLGYSGRGVGDIDGDGVPDFVLSAPVPPPPGFAPGLVRTYSGASGGILYEIAGMDGVDIALGLHVTGAGDVDGDGLADFAVASTLDFIKGRGAAQILMYSGATGTLLWSRENPALFAQSLDGGADFDGDSVADIAVAFGCDVVVLSGTDGEVIFEYADDECHDAYQPEWYVDLGYAPTESRVAWAGDVDKDGHADLLIGRPDVDDGVGEVLIVFGPGAPTTVIPGEPGDAFFGAAVAGIGDANGDGLSDIAVGAPGGPILSNTNKGVVRVYSTVTLAWTNVGGELAGAVGEPLLAGIGTLEADSDTTLRLSRSLAFAPAFFVVGMEAIDAPFKGGVLVPEPMLVIGGVATNASGGLTVSGRWPAIDGGRVTFYFQAWIVDPAGPQEFAASNALSATPP